MKMIIKFYENCKKILTHNNEERFAQWCFKTYSKITIIKGYSINMRKDRDPNIFKNLMSV